MSLSFVGFTLLLLSPIASEPAPVVGPRTFTWAQWRSPDRIFDPAYFWLWNGPLEPDVIRRQLADMASHEARNVCVLPMPREFRSDSTANRMDADYLSPEFFDRVRAAVEESAKLGMHYWLYDEGGWPSGQAAGRVVAKRPDLAAQTLRPDTRGQWAPSLDAGRPDLLNPESTRVFIETTHEQYRKAVGKHFGKTIQLVFTDEPAFPYFASGRQAPWTRDGSTAFSKRFGYRLEDSLTAPSPQTRIDLLDFASDRFHDGYFIPLRDWSRKHQMAHGGHLGGEDETIGSAKYGFGQILRQLRAMDVPGVDAIWRQVFPGKLNHHFPKFASSAAHQNGTSLALTESFCVYGSGLTPAEMKWLIDYQYVRGLNLLVAGCYPLITHEHHMLGERPHFGPVNPLWDFLPSFHRYVARLGSTLACGRPSIDVALYIPIRDVWATGKETSATTMHDLLGRSLLEKQRDYDVVDDDVLSSPANRIQEGGLIVGPMRYRTIVLGPTEYIAKSSLEKIQTFEAAGGRVVRIRSPAEVEERLRAIPPTVPLKPPGPGVRIQVRQWPHGGAAFFFNEGTDAYSGTAELRFDGPLWDLDPSTGAVARVDFNPAELRMNLQPGESRLIVSSTKVEAPVTAPASPSREMLSLASGWQARVAKDFRVAEKNYEIVEGDQDAWRAIELGSWSPLVGDDFSGRVVYRSTVSLPPAWRGRRARLELGRADYSASVSIDDKPVGVALWKPWTVEIAELPIRESMTLEIEVANTLANLLTAKSTIKAWSAKSGPGWPGPYHDRALVFEKGSRSGGLFGPIRLLLLDATTAKESR